MPYSHSSTLVLMFLLCPVPAGEAYKQISSVEIGMVLCEATFQTPGCETLVRFCIDLLARLSSGCSEYTLVELCIV